MTRVTDRVEVYCGTNHTSIFYKGEWKCRYSRGFVGIEDTGLLSISHECHLCNCYWTMRADTPPEKQICDNCHGPAIATGRRDAMNLISFDTRWR